jgi:hypothetical protein
MRAGRHGLECWKHAGAVAPDRLRGAVALPPKQARAYGASRRLLLVQRERLGPCHGQARFRGGARESAWPRRGPSRLVQRGHLTSSGDDARSSRRSKRARSRHRPALDKPPRGRSRADTSSTPTTTRHAAGWGGAAPPPSAAGLSRRAPGEAVAPPRRSWTTRLSRRLRRSVLGGASHPFPGARERGAHPGGLPTTASSRRPGCRPRSRSGAGSRTAPP